MMKRFVGTAAMLVLGGCGPHMFEMAATCTEGADCAECEDGAVCNGEVHAQASADSESSTAADSESVGNSSQPPGTPVVIPAAFATDVDARVSPSPTEVDSASWSLPGFDPSVFSSLSLADIDVLLSLFADDLVLDLLTPAEVNNDLSFLERLCRQGDTPEFICRQRFGD